MVLGLFRRTLLPPPSVSEGVLLYAIGDVHGKRDLLADLLQRITQDAAAIQAGTSSRLTMQQVFLGDYIDRGEASAGVIDLLLEPPPQSTERIFLRGNHEQTLLDCLHNPARIRDWMQFGGLQTLASYGITLPLRAVDASLLDTLAMQLREKLPPAHLAFLQATQLHYVCGDYAFVHAGIHPKRRFAKQQAQDMLWIREPFLSHRKPFEHYIVHGHTPQSQPSLLANRANLDVSGAMPANLCALRLYGQTQAILWARDVESLIDN
jgi:serine/threonine protein phosphatase 1